MTQPIYQDGYPVNLEAAALDALEWLRIMQQHIQRIREQRMYQGRLQEDKDRLQRLIDAIGAFVPDKPVYRVTGEPEPQGWAEVVDIIEIDR